MGKPRKKTWKRIRMKTKTAALLWTLIWFGFSLSAFGAEMRMKSVGELIGFKDNVNNEQVTQGWPYSLILTLISFGKSLNESGLLLMQFQRCLWCAMVCDQQSQHELLFFTICWVIRVLRRTDHQKRHPRLFLLHHKRVHWIWPCFCRRDNLLLQEVG